MSHTCLFDETSEDLGGHDKILSSWISAEYPIGEVGLRAAEDMQFHHLIDITLGVHDASGERQGRPTPKLSQISLYMLATHSKGRENRNCS